MIDDAETGLTPLDRAHAAMVAAGDAQGAELSFYATLVAAELFVMLEREVENDQITPEIFEVEGTPYLLAFDTETRLAGFAGRIVPYAALSGRSVAEMLAGQGVGMALNLESGPAAMLLPPEAMEWLVQVVGEAPSEAEARPEEISPPFGLPETLLRALDARLAAAVGLAKAAYLVNVRYAGGASGHLLGIVAPLEGAEGALARAVQEALSLSGLEAGALDVAFFDAPDPMAASLARHGLRFDLPQPEAPSGIAPPGMDPDAPPKLK